MNQLKKMHLILTIIIFIIDRITKLFALKLLLVHEPIIINPIINLFLTYNTGGAFSLFSKYSGWQTLIFELTAIFTTIFLFIWQKNIVKNHFLKIGIAFIIGGTLGNLYDRIIYSKVIDFIDIHFSGWHYPTFNIADSAIFIGALMLLICINNIHSLNKHN